MTQAKRAKREPTADLRENALGIEPEMYENKADGPLWLHDEKLEALVARANPDGAADAKQVLADARLVDGWILATNSAHHGQLVKYAASAWPDGTAVPRLNAALGLLQAGGRIHRVP